jgi:hypothetical protein
MANRAPAKADVLQGTLDLMVLQTVATTGNNRKARFYTITAAGRRQLTTEKAEWERMNVDHARALARRALTRRGGVQ